MRDSSILLLTPPYQWLKVQYPSVGIAYLAANLTQFNIRHNIMELSLYQDWQNVLEPHLKKYEFIGISATTSEMSAVGLLVDYIKENAPETIIVLGGVHATSWAKEVLEKFDNIDFCIRGEGEKSLIDLVCHKDKTKINGLCYRDKGKIICSEVTMLQDLDVYPVPDYDKFDWSKYHHQTNWARTVYIITSRGCPFTCTYCSRGIGKIFRPRSPSNVVSEIVHMKGRYRVQKFLIADDNFSLDIQRAKEICRLLIDKKINITWSAGGGLRVDRVDDELFNLMKSSGCVALSLGIESASNKILEEYNKKISVDKIKKAVGMAKNNGITQVHGVFLIGAPSDTREDIFRQLEFAKDLNLDYAFWSNIIPYPDTEIWEWIDKNNYWIVDSPFEAIQKGTFTKYSVIYETPLLSAEEKNILIKNIEIEWAVWRGTHGKLFYRIRYLIRKNSLVYFYAKKFKVFYEMIINLIRDLKYYLNARLSTKNSK